MNDTFKIVLVTPLRGMVWV